MNRKPVAFVSVTNDLYTDQRVHKVCTFLSDHGYKVTLVGRRKKDSPALDERAYATHRMKLLFEKGPLFYASYNLRLFFFLLFRKADLYVSNDLDTLLANYLASRFKRKVKLVYDTHEYFTEVPELLNRPKVRSIWLRIERYIFPKLKFVYTVNQSIADIYANKYGVPVKVVRNISPTWKPKKLFSKEELGIPENKPLIIIQGAGINIHRGAEEAVEAMQHIDAVLMIVGDGDVVPQLKKYVKDFGLDEKVLFFGKQVYDKMMNYTYYADIGLTLDRATNQNYALSLPNKVFDYIHGETPIVATPIKAVKELIEQYEIGVVLQDLSVEILVNTINELLNNPDDLERYRENCAKAARHESWEHECQTLKQIYI
ncbi:MAG: glycosyltransferase [Bacteroidetes bacterium]|nr:MAG: glycosyltransferase [Bacteroidota bacterium]